MTRRVLPWLLAALLAVVGGAGAREFRAIEAIATPAALPAGAMPLAAPQPIPRAEVERAVQAVADAWNGGTLDPLLGDAFSSKSRLLDTIAEVVPRDARLEVLAVQAVSVLAQYRHAGRTVSTVSAVVRSQVTFNDPVTGYQRLEGSADWFFEVVEPDATRLSHKPHGGESTAFDSQHSARAPGAAPRPTHPMDDGRMHSAGSAYEFPAPRETGSGSASGTRQGQAVPAGMMFGSATVIDDIPPVAIAAADRPGPDGARIDAVNPTPLLPGQDMVLRGRNFGRDGRLYLEVAGLRLQLAPTRWQADEVVAPLPAELAPLLGSDGQVGRVWLYADAGIATAGDLAVGDVAIRIDAAPLGFGPAQQIRIAGARFLADPPGSVSLECPALGRRFEGTILRWTDTEIDVIPTGSFSGRVESADCELVVVNGRAHEARRMARLEVHNVTRERGATLRWNFATDGALIENIFYLGRRMLRNGWIVVDVRLSVDPDGGHRYSWLTPPVAGSTDTLVEIVGSMRSGDNWDRTREVRVDWTLEGPEGAPQFE